MVLLVLAAVVAVLLLVHRADGDLRRTVVEYALVAVLAVQLAATPSTAGMTAGVASGVTSGGDKVADLARGAWRASFGGPAKASAPATTPPSRKAKQPPEATKDQPAAKQRPPAASSPTSTSPPTALLAVLGGLVLLLGLLLGRRGRGRSAVSRRELAPLLAGWPVAEAAAPDARWSSGAGAPTRPANRRRARPHPPPMPTCEEG
jgi:hypothetical protein